MLVEAALVVVLVSKDEAHDERGEEGLAKLQCHVEALAHCDVERADEEDLEALEPRDAVRGARELARDEGGVKVAAHLGLAAVHEGLRVLHGALDVLWGEWGHNIDHKVGRVGVGRENEASSGVVGCDFVDGAVVDDLAAVEDEEVVKLVEDASGRLVDCAHDCAVVVDAEIVEDRDETHCACAVEAAGGLVEEEQLGAHEELDGDAEALALAARDALDKVVADDCVFAGLEAELADDLVDALELVLARKGWRETEVCGVDERLAHGEMAKEQIVLHHIAGELLEHAGVVVMSREGCGGVFGQFGIVHAAREQIEQGGLSGTARAHDGEQLALDAAADVLEQGLFAVHGGDGDVFPRKLDAVALLFDFLDNGVLVRAVEALAHLIGLVLVVAAVVDFLDVALLVVAVRVRVVRVRVGFVVRRRR
eukprot:comp20603_c0_seq1/m.41939 comp20603_c0_seq1/g.41939  ORF comp20603_c0_seq1/g.41939 comp20603_c0_seq1/m.41939 type:complete len:424 (+) comp20603_c0_seq1:413-1684(+)